MRNDRASPANPYVSTAANKSPPLNIRWTRYTVLCVFVIAVLVCLFFISGNMGTAYNQVAWKYCDENLRHFYSALQRYQEKRGDLPKNEHGFSWQPLEEDEVWMESDFYPCQGELSFGSCYLLKRRLSEIASDSDDDTFPDVVAFDRPGNHTILKANGLKRHDKALVQEQANLLLSDGRVINWRGSAQAYREWVDAFNSGVGAPYPPGVEQQLSDW